MRPSRLALLLTGCALLALASPVAAQDAAPIVIDPPLRPQQAPVLAPAPGGDSPSPSELHPPAVVPADEPVAEPEPVAPPIPEIWAPVPTDGDGRSAYGLYLSGRVASIRGERTEAAELLAESQALTPEQPTLTDQAFRTSLFTGDLETVVRLTPSVQDTPLLSEAGRLIGMAQSLRTGDGATALAALREQPFAAPFASVGRYMLPSVAAAAGDWDTALAPVETAPNDPAGLIMRIQRAHLLEARRRYDDADAEYKALTALPNGVRLASVDYGEFLERRGRRDEAVAQYRASLSGPSPDPSALDGLERAASRGRPPASPTLQETASEVFAFAALEMVQIEQNELAAIFLRVADSLYSNDMTTLRLGLALVSAEQEAPAREAFARVSTANPIIYAGAQYNLAQSLQRDDRFDEALAALRRADASAPSQTRIAQALAGQLVASGREQEALGILARPNIDTADQGADVRFMRGAALESLGRLDEAEGELWAAHQAFPDNPIILNHLGYMWVDSGRRIDQGAEMIARALAADPQNGNIQDSLGWAQFRQGQYDTAVETLESAVAKEPANAEINDHLGDAYWQVGRRREAEWQWKRVLTLEPDAERRAEIEQKLAQGLAPPVPVQTASQP